MYLYFFSIHIHFFKFIFSFVLKDKKSLSKNKSLLEKKTFLLLKMDRNRTTNVKGAAFHKQAKDNLQSILDNFMAIINLIKVEEIQSTQIKDQLPRSLTNTTDDFEMRVRAYNMVENDFQMIAWIFFVFV